MAHETSQTMHSTPANLMAIGAVAYADLSDPATIHLAIELYRELHIPSLAPSPLRPDEDPSRRMLPRAMVPGDVADVSRVEHPFRVGGWEGEWRTP
jgi:hypothetical protein